MELMSTASRSGWMVYWSFPLTRHRASDDQLLVRLQGRGEAKPLQAQDRGVGIRRSDRHRLWRSDSRSLSTVLYSSSSSVRHQQSRPTGGALQARGDGNAVETAPVQRPLCLAGHRLP